MHLFCRKAAFDAVSAYLIVKDSVRTKRVGLRAFPAYARATALQNACANVTGVEL